MQKTTAKRVGKKVTADMILWPFFDFAEEGTDALIRYLIHCGIGQEDLDAANGDTRAAILEHYRQRDGNYDIAAAAHDLERWPEVAARIKELKREMRAKH